ADCAPLVRAMPGLPPRRGGCGVATVRVTPRATVQPCVYWPGGGAPLDLLLELGRDVVASKDFEAARTIPRACEHCAFLPACRGGCAGGGRVLAEAGAGDARCALLRGGEKRRLRIRMAAERELPKTESACTTVVMAR